MLTLTLPQSKLPKGYVMCPSREGYKYYVNVETNTSSLRNPSTYKALQDVGIVDPLERMSTVHPSLAALNKPNIEVPALWRRFEDEAGVIFYAKPDGTRLLSHPYADGHALVPPWVALEGKDGETRFWNKEEKRSQTENPNRQFLAYAVITAGIQEEDYWQTKGCVPAWVVQDMTVPQPGEQAVPYSVNYRTGNLWPRYRRSINLAKERPQSTYQTPGPALPDDRPESDDELPAAADERPPNSLQAFNIFAV
ncbi:hypothetical protein GGTG_07257 [Gaeumannomyces tritici R3-111a-1]|uniref:WW domain-containing protein n=1 Tax=Gaeumannomyces tritici (strain R3-111a-1) TaxID=644352 RepID=J3P160_GAET3|nr:hypothetical protein GGTG_07257 [Gaeumannomyces tritici R3-111a-1]EJT77345.1 hypothetical protein GGTG_07257 [Gaeumannomyces tritici R3-111a-1]